MMINMHKISHLRKAACMTMSAVKHNSCKDALWLLGVEDYIMLRVCWPGLPTLFMPAVMPESTSAGYSAVCTAPVHITNRF
jgi:hypothetical protein